MSNFKNKFFTVKIHFENHEKWLINHSTVELVYKQVQICSNVIWEYRKDLGKICNDDFKLA